LAILEKAVVGGQMRLTSEIENWPGVDRISGEQLSEKMKAQALSYGVEIIEAEVKELAAEDQASGAPRIIKTSGQDYQAKSVIVASGAYHKTIDCLGAKDFVGRGISFCALCDAGFFKNEPVAVVGGGNAALEQAMHLAKVASNVTVIHRRDKFRADKVAQDRLAKQSNIFVILNSEVRAIRGSEEVEKIDIYNLKTKLTSTLPVNGVFLFVGQAPYVNFLPDAVKIAPGGWIETDRRLNTSLPGVFAAGDVRHTSVRQIITAAADGGLAALEAYKYLESHF
jgi:thioredoxin reductase (NADPH)